MMYPYMTLADGTEIVHSQLVEKDGTNRVTVHFERPSKENGFDIARCELPDYQWKKQEGYSTDELHFFEEFLAHNAHLIYKYASKGGVRIA